MKDLCVCVCFTSVINAFFFSTLELNAGEAGCVDDRCNFVVVVVVGDVGDVIVRLWSGGGSMFFFSAWCGCGRGRGRGEGGVR